MSELSILSSVGVYLKLDGSKSFTDVNHSLWHIKNQLKSYIPFIKLNSKK